MVVRIKIDAQLFGFLGEQKAWSQDRLAAAAGVSLRTVQRVESEGVGCPESHA